MKNRDLWARISRHFIAGQQHSLFVDKLMKESRWSKRHCLEVIEEYKRFCYLAALRQGPVSPGHDVDKVWHLHLTFSKDYWRSFCPDVLGMDLHHDPSDASAGEQMKTQYLKTVELYQAEFGESPPAAIWHSTPEQKCTLVSRVWWLLIALFAGTAVTAYAADGDETSWFEILFWCVVGFLILKFLFNLPGGKGGSCSGGSCSSCGGGGD